MIFAVNPRDPSLLKVPRPPHDSHFRSAGEPGKHTGPIPGPDSCVSLSPRPQDTLRTRCVKKGTRWDAAVAPFFRGRKLIQLLVRILQGGQGAQVEHYAESRSLLTLCLPFASCQVSSRVQAPLGMSLQGTPHLRGQCWGESHSHQETLQRPTRPTNAWTHEQGTWTDLAANKFLQGLYQP